MKSAECWVGLETLGYTLWSDRPVWRERDEEFIHDDESDRPETFIMYIGQEAFEHLFGMKLEEKGQLVKVRFSADLLSEIEQSRKEAPA